MARIKGVPAGHAAPSVKIAYWFTRRHFARLTGREPGRGIEPLQIYAHVPRLKQHFDDAQLVQLTHLIALENLRARFNVALGIGAAGFSEGMVCARPVPAEEIA